MKPGLIGRENLALAVPQHGDGDAAMKPGLIGRENRTSEVLPFWRGTVPQ